MRLSKKAFTLVEMLVALAVSSIIIAATFASFELIQKQYKKNIDVAELHTSGRAIMSILEREIRMAGYEFRDGNGLMTYGSITAPIEITDSGNKCCDEVTIIYDEVFDTLNASGVVTSSTVERVKTRFWTEPYTSTKHGTRNRLFKRRTILGTNNALLGTPRVGAKEVMADYVEDLQLINTSGFANLYATDYQSLHVYDTISRKWLRTIPLGYNPGNQSSITIGSDGLVYALGAANGKWTVFIINPKTGSTSLINSPGRNNRWAPGLGIASDGFLYINTTAGGLVDVYDVKTKQLQQSIMPNQQIKNLLSNIKDTNSSGVTCELPNGSNINCSNSSSLGSPKNTKYSTIKFGNDDGDDRRIFVPIPPFRNLIQELVRNGLEKKIRLRRHPQAHRLQAHHRRCRRPCARATRRSIRSAWRFWLCLLMMRISSASGRAGNWASSGAAGGRAAGVPLRMAGSSPGPSGR